MRGQEGCGKQRSHYLTGRDKQCNTTSSSHKVKSSLCTLAPWKPNVQSYGIDNGLNSGLLKIVKVSNNKNFLKGIHNSKNISKFRRQKEKLVLDVPDLILTCFSQRRQDFYIQFLFKIIS